jgi:hypothetical protein
MSDVPKYFPDVMVNNQEYLNNRYMNFDHEINYAVIVDDIIFSSDAYPKRALFQLQRYIKRCLTIFQFTGSGNTIFISITFSFFFRICSQQSQQRMGKYWNE